MTDHMPDDLSAAGRDLRAYTDELRLKHPVIRNVAGEWVLLTHAEVVAAALDHERFSSKVSRYVQIPNGFDGEEHTRYREIIARHLSHDALEPRLLEWMEENHAATRSGDRASMVDVAEQFDKIILSVIQPRRAMKGKAPDDVTTHLCRQVVDGRLLTEIELVSILRNWTGGDLGSIALCIGVLVAYVVQQPGLAERLRTASDSEVESIIDEVLRLDDPFVSNRRITTCPVHIGGQDIPGGARVKLNWTSANRDESAFDNNRFDPERNAAANLVYGVGKHACPGRLLATWELRIALQALLALVQTIELAPDQQPEREVAPVGGYHRVPVILS